MLAVEIELLLGTYRADPTGDAVTNQAVCEWPPAPARILAALIDAGGGSRRNRPDLIAFASEGAPIIYADPDPQQQPLHGRYVVDPLKKSNKTHMEYLARGGTLVRPGVRSAPRDRKIVLFYPRFNPSDDLLSALQYRAARIGYLGCADSPVTVTINKVTEPPTGPAFIPDPEGSVFVNTHTAGHVAVWCTAFDAWAKEGVNRRRFPALRHQTSYRHPDDPAPEEDQGRVLVWFQFADTVLGRRVATVAQTFKGAVYARYQELYEATPPGWFHGHNISQSGGEWQLARILPLPNVGHPYSDSRIHGVALWVPPGVNEMDARRIGEAARAVDHLTGITDGLALADHRDQRRSVWATNPRRWTSPSRQWASVFPAVSDRHHGPRRRLTVDDIARWCRQAGIPAPIAVRLSRKPLISGGIDLSRPETARPGHTQTRPWTHFEIFFEEKIRGPVVIGAARSYGLGLCAPVDESIGGKERV